MMNPVLNLSPENQALLAKRRAKLLRNPTQAETYVKNLLMQMNEPFIFQKGFFTTKKFFIVDFYFKKRKKLCLEIDGPYHEDQREYDRFRDDFLENERGFRMVRISNEMALNLSPSTLEAIISICPNDE